MKRKVKAAGQPLAAGALRGHFGKIPLESLVSSARTFPMTAQVDLQRALDRVLTARGEAPRLWGFFRDYAHDTATFSHLLERKNGSAHVGPLQYDEVDLGEAMPERCLKQGFWTCRSGKTPFLVILSPALEYGKTTGIHIEVVGPTGEAGLAATRDILAEVERETAAAGSYRGKVLSLEKLDDYSGQSGGVKVHRLRPVERDEVILPAKTLALLERNVHQFVGQRERLKALKLGTKKGLLFYGPPGTGKTHTIHYLAGQLPGHTTLLITAAQVGLLQEYMQLARFLQPAVIVMEDVDLIARERTRASGPCAESLLNSLLNEMDGLREDAALLFILTTNRPEELEAALASRPGRIDQAIEFPLPDPDGRRRLVELYGGALKVSQELSEAIVAKTDRASAAFMKELMRRSAQVLLARGGETALKLSDVDDALDEMLVSGGSLNVKLLGAASHQPCTV